MTLHIWTMLWPKFCADGRRICQSSTKFVGRRIFQTESNIDQVCRTQDLSNIHTFCADGRRICQSTIGRSNNKNDVTREHSDYLHTVEALARTVQSARESEGEPAAVHFRPGGRAHPPEGEGEAEGGGHQDNALDDHRRFGYFTQDSPKSLTRSSSRLTALPTPKQSVGRGDQPGAVN